MQNNHIHVLRGDYYDGYLWYPSQKDGLLLKINIENGQVDYVCSLQLPEEEQAHSYHQIVSLGDKEFLAIPGVGNKILKLDLKSGEQTFYDFPNSGRQIKFFSKFTSCIKYGEKIYCIPGNMNYVLGIEHKTMKLWCRDDIMKDIDSRIGEIPAYFSWNTVRKGNTVYAVGPWHNFLLEMNLDTQEYVLTELANEDGVCGYTGVAVHGGKVYAVNTNCRVRAYDLQEKSFLRQIDTAKKYWAIQECKDNLLLISARTDCYAWYCMETGEIREVPYPEENHFYDVDNANIFARDIIERDGKYYIISSFNNMLIVVDKENAEMKFIPLYYGESLIRYLYQKNNGVITEGRAISNRMSVGLEEFIRYCGEYENKK